MRKDLNAVRGGAERMVKRWEGLGEAPPVKLMSKFEARAVTAAQENEKPTSAKGSRRAAIKAGGPLDRARETQGHRA